MRTADFDYHLPPELVAREPSARRDGCRLLHVAAGREADSTGESGAFEHLQFHQLADRLRKGDLLVLNDTRVLRARLVGRRRPGGGRAELLLLEPDRDVPAPDGGLPLAWWCYGKPGRKLKPGTWIDLGATRIGDAENADPAAFDEGNHSLRAEIVDATDDGRRLARFHLPQSAESLQAELERAGHPPLPPYILAARKKFEHDETLSHDSDAQYYQTVFAREGLSVAAPTAGLHFTEAMLEELKNRGVEIARIRLDIGAGTFKPVDEADPRDHPMHSESYWIDDDAAEAVNAAKKEGRRVIAIGTTALRALESAALEAEIGGVDWRNAAPRSSDIEPDDTGGASAVRSGARSTDLLILPGYRFRIVDGLVTNLHLPKSTLLMLVAALGGTERIMAAYREAIDSEYRFYSYGDAMLIWRAGEK